MQVAQSKTRDQFPLSYKKVMKKSLSVMIVWGVLLIIIQQILVWTATFFNESDSEWMQIAILGIWVFFFLFSLLTYLYQHWYFVFYFYDLSEDFIQIKKGPITPREITLPYERIQDIYVDQDLLDRILGLYDVHLSSATISSGMEAHIDGLGKKAAEGLRSALLGIIKDRIGKIK